MREILFRGKSSYSCEWVEGYFSMEVGGIPYIQWLEYDDKYHEEVVEECAVILDTVGQYTGLKDKNGTRIFEGDIVKITGFHTTAIAAVKYGSRSEKSTSWGWYFDDNDGHTYHLESQAFCKDYNAIIIGNIHDNPELLKGVKSDERT